MSEDRRSLLQKLLDEWPGVAGLLLVGIGVLHCYYFGRWYGRGHSPGIGLIIIGVLVIGYWAWADKPNDDFNF